MASALHNHSALHNPALSNASGSTNTRLGDGSAKPHRAPAQGDSRLSQRAKLILSAVFGGTLALALAYVVGRVEGSAASDAIERRAQRTLEGQKESTLQLRRQLQQLEQRTTQLEARRQLHLCILALEQHNFGTARDHLVLAHDKVAHAVRLAADSKAGSDAVVGTAPGPKDTGLASFARTLADFPLQVTSDIAAQRQQLGELARQLDALLEGRTVSVETRASSAETPNEH